MATMTGGKLPAAKLSGKSLLRIALVTAVILLVPLVAMQFTREVNWTLGDFVVAGGLLMGTGLLFDLAVRKIRTQKARLITIGAIALGFLFVWTELAVGIVGSPFAGS
ncbi:hypothetical protein [Massilia litorea]|uniref:hypothetical protein n=1 Tax=Massilia litorea TaxID=2769491 RepID=UPI001D0D15D4|nr:hypothetical protein [Massilia litorea]